MINTMMREAEAERIRPRRQDAVSQAASDDIVNKIRPSPYGV
jgi:hypothetical protein